MQPKHPSYSRSLVPLLAAVTLAVSPAISTAVSDLGTSSGGVLRLAEGSQNSGSTLANGTAIVASSRKLLRSSERVTVGPVKIRSNGTALISTTGGNAKITCLEGSAHVHLAANRRQFLELTPGQMLLIENGAASMPAPVMVNLARLHETASVLSRDLPPLPRQKKMVREIQRQQAQIDKGHLVKSDVAINGNSSDVSTSSSTSSSNSNSSSSSGGSSGGGSGGGGGGAVGGGGGALSSHSCSA